MWRDVFLNNQATPCSKCWAVSRKTSPPFNAPYAGAMAKRFTTLFDRARRMRREVIEAGQDTSAPNWGRDELGV